MCVGGGVGGGGRGSNNWNCTQVLDIIIHLSCDRSDGQGIVGGQYPLCTYPR